MTKVEFLASLRERLKDLPMQEIEERIGFYSEMIADRMEDGIPEEDAVAEIRAAEENGVAETAADGESVCQPTAEKLTEEKTGDAEKVSEKKLSTWAIVLIALGFPVWISLIAAAAATVLSVYVSLWAGIASLWSVFGASVASVVGGAVSGIVYVYQGKLLAGIALIGAGIFCAGLSVFVFYGCKAATEGTVWITRKSVTMIKKLLVKKERVK